MGSAMLENAPGDKPSPEQMLNATIAKETTKPLQPFDDFFQRVLQQRGLVQPHVARARGYFRIATQTGTQITYNNEFKDRFSITIYPREGPTITINQVQDHQKGGFNIVIIFAQGDEEQRFVIKNSSQAHRPSFVIKDKQVGVMSSQTIQPNLLNSWALFLGILYKLGNHLVDPTTNIFFTPEQITYEYKENYL